MKRSLLAGAVFLTIALPFVARADGPAQITVNVNVRYQGSLAWSGPVTLTKGATTSISDDTGVAQTIPSDSALEALATADAASADFAVSDLKYYSDYGSFFINCIDIAAASAHACNNWQYVVDSAFPSVGADKYSLSDGDTVYFFFGSPRRVVLSAPTAAASTSVAVTAQSYDYTNDTWVPLSGAVIGATQPNPNDPYSPLVISSATSGADGVANIFLSAPGTYGIGLAQDYYSSPQTFTVTAVPTTPAPTAPAATTASNSAPTTATRSGGSSGGGATARAVAPATPAAAPAAATAAIDPATATVSFDVPLDVFVQRYTELTAKPTNAPVVAVAPKQKAAATAQTVTSAASPAPIAPAVSQTAAAAEAAPKGWFKSLLSFFGL